MKFVGINNSSSVTLRVDRASSSDFVGSPAQGATIAPSSTFSLSITDAELTAGWVQVVVVDAPAESVWIEWGDALGLASPQPDNDTIDPRVEARAFVDSDNTTTLRVEIRDATKMTCTITIVNKVGPPDGFTLVRRMFGPTAGTTLSPDPPARLDPGDTGTFTATRMGRPPAGFATYAIESRPHELAHLGWADNAIKPAQAANLDGATLGDLWGRAFGSGSAHVSSALEKYYLTPVLSAPASVSATRFRDFTMARSVTLQQATNFAFSSRQEAETRGHVRRGA